MTETTIRLDQSTATMLHQVAQVFSQMTGTELEQGQVIAALCSSFLDGIHSQQSCSDSQGSCCGGACSS